MNGGRPRTAWAGGRYLRREQTDSCVLPPPRCSLLVAGNVVVAVLAVAQEARELGGERVAGRQVGLLRELVDRRSSSAT